MKKFCILIPFTKPIHPPSLLPVVFFQPIKLIPLILQFANLLSRRANNSILIKLLNLLIQDSILFWEFAISIGAPFLEYTSNLTQLL